MTAGELIYDREMQFQTIGQRDLTPQVCQVSLQPMLNKSWLGMYQTDWPLDQIVLANRVEVWP